MNSTATPTKRTVPEGKILLAEYGDIKNNPEEMAVTTVIRTETRRRDNGADVPAEYRYDRPKVWTLSHQSHGFVCAGSCLRYKENATYRVLTSDDGAIYGQHFLTLEEAEAWLAKRGDVIA
jgi:hypothetical protein